MEKTGPKVSFYGRKNLTGACHSTTGFSYFNVFLLLFPHSPRLFRHRWEQCVCTKGGENKRKGKDTCEIR